LSCINIASCNNADSDLSVKTLKKEALEKHTYFLGGWIDAAQLGCFKLLHQAVNHSWVEAQLKCEDEGGYLAEPQTARSERLQSTNV
jgi:hypothetical protein